MDVGGLEMLIGGIDVAIVMSSMRQSVFVAVRLFDCQFSSTCPASPILGTSQSSASVRAASACSW